MDNDDNNSIHSGTTGVLLVAMVIILPVALQEDQFYLVLIKVSFKIIWWQCHHQYISRVNSDINLIITTTTTMPLPI